MTVFTERTALRQRMEDIRQERKDLNEEYYTILDRLRELDNQERESIDTDTVISSLVSAVKTLQELTPSIPTDVLINTLAKKVEESGIEVTQQTEASLIPKQLVEEQQYRDSKKHLHEKPVAYKPEPVKPEVKPEPPKMDVRTGKAKSAQSQKINELIVQVLKEKGVPITLGTLQEGIEKEVGPINRKTMVSKLRSMVEHDPKVTKPMRGFYQYQM